MSEDTIDYKKLAEALAEALEQRNLWIEGEEYRELVILRMRLSNKVESLAEELEAANARIAELEAENEKMKKRVTELAWTDRPTVLFDLKARIAELEAECASLGVRLHDEMSQLEIATDLGNKRWLALNDIYENGEKHNANWCKRKAQKGLGIK